MNSFVVLARQASGKKAVLVTYFCKTYMELTIPWASEQVCSLLSKKLARWPGLKSGSE